MCSIRSQVSLISRWSRVTCWSTGTLRTSGTLRSLCRNNGMVIKGMQMCVYGNAQRRRHEVVEISWWCEVRVAHKE